MIINLLLFLVFLILGLAFFIGFYLSEKGYKGPVSDHFDGKRFKNPSQKQAGGFKDVIKYGIKRDADPVSFDKNAIVNNDFTSIEFPEGKFRITFVNHTTFLIETEHGNFLTDPIWSRRCSPFQFAGPGRLRLPGIPIESLPEINYVLLSHNHYDHLDVGTIKYLKQHHECTYIVPLGVSHQLKKLGITNIVEMDWWQSHTFASLKIHAVPANHFSGRGLFDRDRTLWAGYVIEMMGRNLYFAGDTGYSSVFKEIGQRFKIMDISLIPIGAFKPEWFMGPIHVTPGQAMDIHKDVNSIQTIATHFGCFPLADDSPVTTVSRFKEDFKNSGLDPNAFILPQEGRDYIL